MLRSKSAPHPLPGYFAVPSDLPRSSSHVHLDRRVQKSARGFSQVHPSASPVISPRSEREDPFSLSGFFPSSMSSENEEWSWLRDEDKPDEDDGTLIEDEAAVRMLDGDLKEMIKKEDKMGILSLGTFA